LHPPSAWPGGSASPVCGSARKKVTDLALTGAPPLHSPYSNRGSDMCESFTSDTLVHTKGKKLV
jgi:hypothetical protein